MLTRTYGNETRTRKTRLSRGAASVEAVIVLPVLIILFVSVFYVRNQVLARQAAERQARTCAWAYSMNNCSAVPPGCSAQIVSAAGPLGGKIEGKLSKASGGIAGPVVNDVLDPVLRAAFGKALDAKSQVPYERPAIYGGGTQTASGGYHLACNLTTETLEYVGKDAWDALKSNF